VNGVDFRLAQGEVARMGLLGESGSGKSVTLSRLLIDPGPGSSQVFRHDSVAIRTCWGSPRRTRSYARAASRL